MNFDQALVSLSQTKIPREFWYWIAAWIAYGQQPDSGFLYCVLISDIDESQKIQSEYGVEDFLIIDKWLRFSAPKDCFGSRTIANQWHAKKTELRASELISFAEAQHRS